MTDGKTVYILGAGTSKTIGLPLQGELLNSIFTLEPGKIDTNTPLMEQKFNLHEQELLTYYEEFNEQRIKLANFIVENFASESLKTEYSYESVKAEYCATKKNEDDISPTFSDNMSEVFSIASSVSVTLEDLFTLFDKIIIGREHFRIYSPDKIQETHTALRKCIIFTLAYFHSVKVLKENPIQHLAEILIQHRLNVEQAVDNLAIITMNWDSSLEKSIFQVCAEYNKKNKLKVFPDLCFYDYPYDPKEHRIVSTQIKARGHNNIKILKLHGSINWLVCPYCGRVFVDYKRDIAVDEMLAECYCPICLKEFNGNGTSPKMHSMLITPTFLKDLNNLHIKNIWHNALINLTEASKIVFIGYSFPDADFEMRCLLKKAIRPETKIEVILHEEDDPKHYEEILKKQGVSKNVLPVITEKLKLPENRYASFFGKDRVKFYYCGMEEYLHNTFSGEVKL